MAVYTGPFTGGFDDNSNGYSSIDVNTTSFTGGLTNSGTITGAATGIIVTGSIITGSINDIGVISGSKHGIALDGESTINGSIEVGGSDLSGGISSAGEILSHYTGIVVAMVSFFSGGISNSGTIASTGTRVGIYVVQSSIFSGGFANSGVITSANKQSVLINGNTHFTGGVSNGGTIAGHLTGLFVIDNVSFSGGVSNSGLITSASNVGLYVYNNSSFSGGISNGGTIDSKLTGIFVRNDSTFSGGITNTGTISGSADIVAVGSGRVQVDPRILQGPVDLPARPFGFPRRRMVQCLLFRGSGRCREIPAEIRRRDIRSEATRERQRLGALEESSLAPYMSIMCGRVHLSSDYSEIKIKLKFDPDYPAPNFAPDWNKPPTEPMLVAIAGGRQAHSKDDEMGPRSSLGEGR